MLAAAVAAGVVAGCASTNAYGQEIPQQGDVAAIPSPGEADADEPLAPLPDMEVDWPDMGQEMAPLPPMPPIADGQIISSPEVEEALAVEDPGALPGSQGEAAVAAGSPTSKPPGETRVETVDSLPTDQSLRYSVQLVGVDNVEDPQLRSRFNALSILESEDGRAANGAQLNRRVMQDAELFERILRNDGYYDATITSQVNRENDQLIVSLIADTGPVYTYRTVRLTGLEPLGLVESARLTNVFAPGPGDPIIADRLVAAQQALLTEMLETGYPFAAVGEEDILIDHDIRQGDLTQPTAPGARLRFGQVVADDSGLLGANHIQRIARFDPGDWYKQSEVEDLRRALIATGIVSSVTVTPQQSANPENVDLNVALTPAPLRTIAGALGYGSGEGVRAEVSWEHRNLFPPEGALILRGVAGTQEQLAEATFRRNNVTRRDHILTIRAAASHIDRAAYDANSASLSGRFERVSTLLYQKRWSWAAGAELTATDERSFVVSINQFSRRTYYIGALSGSVTWDTSDSLLDPTTGARVTLRLAPEVSFHNKAFIYLRGQLDGSMYRRVGDGVVLAARARVGSLIGGVSTESIAPSRRFYAGGGGSVRGYGYQAIGARDINNDPVGGRSVVEFAAEARVRAFGEFSVVPFIDAGNVYDNQTPDFSGLRYGAGLGVRYRSNFGPIRVDVATPLNRRPGDSRIAVYVSLGQAF